MPLETATFIQDLVTSNPAASDGLNNADDHMRLIKGVLKGSFPNFDAALTSAPADIDAAVSATINGVSVLGDAGVHFKTNTKDGIENPAAGKVSIVAQDAATPTPAKQTVAEFTGTDKKLKVLGPLQAVGPFSGGTGQLVPIGGSIMWFEDTLPVEGGYVWANGQIITNASTACPVLLARWGDKYGGNGVTTMGVPDMREVVPIGKSTMGLTSPRGIITNFTSTLLTTLGGYFGTAAHVLTTGQMPKHRHGAPIFDPSHSHTYAKTNFILTMAGGAFTSGVNSTDVQTGSSMTGVRVKSADGTLDATDISGDDEAHPNVQPSAVVNWIIRIG